MRDLRVDVAAGEVRASVEAALRRAMEEGDVDVAVGSIDTAVGTFGLAVSERGLLAVEFGGTEAAAELVAKRLTPRVVEIPTPALDDIRRQLDEYFAGHREVFDVRLDWSLVRGPYTRQVLEATWEIPFGSVTTYGDLSRSIGNPRASRATGQALGSNPIPIVVPCHRVLATGGGLGGYGGGLHMKEHLLQLEGVLVS